MTRRLAPIVLAAALSACAVTPPASDPSTATGPFVASDKAALLAAVAAPSRTPSNIVRDRYRHPFETLSFFGVRPSDTVVEIWPGGGWYTEILAPYVASGGGKLLLATLDGQPGGVAKLQQAYPAMYRSVTSVVFPTFDGAGKRVPAGTADVVLTFRNVHNWRMGYRRDDKQDYSGEAFRQMYTMLKPGGLLGVVDHRLPETASEERERSSGYLKVSTVRRLAEAAGFRLVGSSEINANPKDSADWPEGVWTLPPSLTLKDQDREKYLAIGESDRMTLKFVKPR